MKKIIRTQKNVFQVKKSQKFVYRLPDEICGLDDHDHYRNNKSTNQNKGKSQKKNVYLVP
jgi:hypothetical protein